MAEDPSLASTLQEFAEEFVSIVEDSREKGTITKVKQGYLRPTIESMQYVDGIPRYSSIHQETLEREEWNFLHDLQPFEIMLKSVPSYLRTLRLIVLETKFTEEQVRWLLSLFARSLAIRVLTRVLIDTKLTREIIIDSVSTLMADVKGEASEWNPIIWLHGVRLLDEQVDISPNLTIRRPTKEELESEDEEHFDSLVTRTFVGERSLMGQYPSAVIELKLKASDVSDVQHEIERLLGALRLFRVGSVDFLRMRFRPTSFTQSMWSGTQWRTYELASQYNYTISRVDAGALKDFFEEMRLIIPLRWGKDLDYVGIALQRYYDTLLKTHTAESGLTSCIMCMEALYLGGEERQELSMRLSQRVAKLLGVFGYNGLEVYNKLRIAYGIRSRYIHGSVMAKQEQQKAAKTLEDVVEYSRASLVVFLQLKEKITKEKLLSLVEDALLSDQKNDKLSELLHSLSTLPNPKS